MNTTLRHNGFILLAALAMPALLLAQSDEPEEGSSLRRALEQGETTLRLRYRYEDVSQDGFDKDAHASTLRTTLGYKTQPYRGFSLELEAENVATLGNDLYNNRGAASDGNGVRDRPVVADPELTEINQAFLRFERGDTELTLGRREIVLGDFRYIGNVGWRQHHQSFDAFTLTNTSLRHTTMSYGYIDKVHRIFGDTQPMSSHFLNAAVKAGEIGTVTLYGYLLDYDRRQDASRSSSTYGIELRGERPSGSAGNKWLYEIEVATQSDAGDNPRRIDAEYLSGVFGGQVRGVTVKAGWESLGGSVQDGQFNTPLATLHAWNGWADKFLATPTNGLEDLQLSVGGKAGKVAWKAIYHDFKAATGDADYGQELDLQLTCKASWNQVFGFKAALYDAETFATDTDKLMFWTTYQF